MQDPTDPQRSAGIMSSRREPDACSVPWCDESGRHDRHMTFVGSVIAADFVGKACTVQVIAESTMNDRPNGAIVLVDSRLMQMAAELSWQQARQVGQMLIDGARRYGA